MTSVLEIQAASTEYLRFPFTSDVDAGTLSGGQVAFVAGRFEALPGSPTWINATIITTGTAHLRVLHGTDVTLAPGWYTWYARFTSSPETPVEMGGNLIRVL